MPRSRTSARPRSSGGSLMTACAASRRPRRFFNNMAHDVFGVAEKMLDGELQYHLGNHEVAYEHLRESVRRDDNLEYIEPWAWMHPPRHALAGLLMEPGHYREAEQIYSA